MTRVVALVTSHNRKGLTLSCLQSYFAQDVPNSVELAAVLVDDGSSDGTAAEVTRRFPNVRVITGTGRLYWGGGMAVAQTSLETTPDFFLWLNDDVVLDAGALALLLECSASGAGAICVGAVRDPTTGAVTYSAVRRVGGHPMRFALVAPPAVGTSLATFNGNVVLIPGKIAQRLGPVDAKLGHSRGDFDYGLRAVAAGESVVVAPRTVGTCERGHWPAQRSRRSSWKLLLGPKGIPPRQYGRFLRRHGGRSWPVYWLATYLLFALREVGAPGNGLRVALGGVSSAGERAVERRAVSAQSSGDVEEPGLARGRPAQTEAVTSPRPAVGTSVGNEQGPQLARGLGWNGAAVAVVLVAQLVTTVITARLLSPHQFGSYAAAQACFAFASYFTLKPLGAAVVRDTTRSSEIAATALLLSCVAGAAVAVVFFAFGPLWASFWRAPGAAPLVRFYGVAVLLLTAAVVPCALLQRDLRFRALALMDGSCQVIGTVTGALMAWWLRAPIALVIGQVLGAALLVSSTAWVSRGEWFAAGSRSAARTLLDFSGKVSVQNGVYYVLLTAPAWTVARIFGQTALGFFSRANLLVSLPTSYITTNLTRVLYPMYARLRGNDERLRDFVTRGLAISRLVTWVILAAGAACAPLLVTLLLGERWAFAGSLVPWIALAAAANVSFVIVANATEALRELKLASYLQLVWGATLAAFLGAAWIAGAGIRGYLIAAAGGQAVAHAAQLVAWRRRGWVDLRLLARAYGVHGVIALAVYGIVRVAPHAFLGRISRPTELSVQLAVVVVLAVGLAVVRNRFPGLRSAPSGGRLEHPGFVTS